MITVYEALLRELEKLPTDLSESALAASALAMAREIDSATNSATSKSMCQARLQDAWLKLQELRPPVHEADGVDAILARMEAQFDDRSSAPKD